MPPHALHLAALRPHLDPALLAALDAEGQLPADARRDLADRLRADIAACAAFVPARVLRAQLARPSPGRVAGAFWHGSLLFADLSGFTALTEQLSVLGRQGAEEISAVVSRLFAALLSEIHAHQGTLLKFGGDAVIAFFDADTIGERHAQAAAAAALAMQRRMAEFAHLPTRAGDFALQLRIGVHSGRLFAAEVGDEEHVELVVTGPEVAQVALAQEQAAPGQVLITPTTAALLPEATTTPASHDLLALEDVPSPRLPPPTSDPLARHGPDDLATLVRLAERLAALRPYLLRGLPRRFLEASASSQGEFRLVTVLFANLAGFAPLLTALPHDPDVAAAAFNSYFRRAQALVHRYGGVINKVDMATDGDKLMALFGAPAAHEDDPTRAVRCALDLAQCLAEAEAEIAALLGSPVALSQRIGLATGTVFAGRVGGEERYEYTVMGPAVNLAARLMAAAAPGELLLSPSTRTAVAGQVVLEVAPPLRLKGISEPVLPSRALRMAAVAATPRDDVGAVRLAAAPLIGRERELQTLLDAAYSALRGHGRVLALVGEAGTGKSRQVEELLQRLVAASAELATPAVPPFAFVLGECQSYQQRTPYAAINGPLRDLLGLGSRDAAREAELVRARVAQLAPELERFAPLLGDLVGLSLGETALTTALSPEQRHNRLQELVVALFCAAAAREPLLLGLEDLHWADGPSLELLGRLAAAAADLPLLLVLTYRPEPPIAASWEQLPTTLRLFLAELTFEQSAALLAALLGGTPPPDVLPLLERTEGNPFFIEELVRALVSGGLLLRDPDGTWSLAQPLSAVELPNSIQGLLMARIDRLDEPRQDLIQVASVVGRRFPRPVIEGVYAAAPLDESLQRLVSDDLIQVEQLERLLAYLFRHALLRDVAYDGILYARRRALHSRVARRIEELSRDQPDEQLAVLAWHYLQAEEWRSALHFHLRAAEQAARRFANREALALYATALAIVPQLAAEAGSSWRDEQLAAVHECCGELRLLLGELDDAEQHLRAALALATAPPEAGLRLRRLLASVEERRSRYDQAFAWLHQAMARADSTMAAETARCYLLGAGIYFRQGEYLRAMEWARMALTLAEQIGSQAEEAAALKLIGNLHRDLGDTGQALAALERARDLFAALNLLGGQSDALNNLGILYTRAGRWPETIASFEASLQISESIGDVLAVARTANNLAVVLVGRNQLERAGELYGRSGAMFARVGSALGVAVTTYNRGEVLLLQGRPAEALPLFLEPLAEFERIGARNFMPEVLRLAAEAQLALHELPAAHQHAARALELAVELGMAPEEATARRVVGQIAMAGGDLATAAQELERSRAALATLDNRYELGKTRYHQARLALAGGDAAGFAAASAEASAIFIALDAQRDLALVRALNGPVG